MCLGALLVYRDGKREWKNLFFALHASHSPESRQGRPPHLIISGASQAVAAQEMCIATAHHHIALMSAG